MILARFAVLWIAKNTIPTERNKMKRYAHVSTLALLTALTVFGGVASAESLADAVALAYQTNPSLLSQRAQLRALDERYVQARQALRPIVTLDGVARATTSIVGSGSSPTRDRHFTTSTVGLSATQLLSSFGRTSAQVSAAEATLLAGREALRQAEGDLLFDVMAAYAAVRRDEQIVSIRTQTVAAFQRQVDQTQARIKGGDGTLTDLGQAEAQLSSSQAALAQSQAQLEASRASYAALVGQNPGTLDPEPTLNGLPINIDEAFKVAQDDSPVVLQAVMNERAGRANIRAAKARFRPTLSMTGEYIYTGVEPFKNVNIDGQLVAGLSLSMPIISGGLNRSAVREAEQNDEALYANIEASRRQVVQSLAASWNQVIAAERQYTYGQTAVRAAQVSSQGARLEYREGGRSFFEVLNEEQRLLESQLIVAQANYARFVGQAAVLNAMGRLNTTTVLEGFAPYDPKKNFDRVRSKGSVPWEPIVATVDRLTGPGDRARRDAPDVAPVTATLKASSTRIAADQPLVTAIPVRDDGIGELLEKGAQERP
jgi:outer membrane protein